jgi:hypothetical protein
MSSLQTPQVRDLMSVGSRVSWSAVTAGALLALAICLLMTTLGAAVGLSLGERVSAKALETGNLAWGLLTAFTALFVGGLLCSLLTVGETKTEGVVHGILTWALLLALVFLLGSAGVRTGFVAPMPGTVEKTVGEQAMAPGTVEPGIAVRQAETSEETLRRMAWVAFAATWLSMLAAAAGGFLGAGPTFRVASVTAVSERIN